MFRVISWLGARGNLAAPGPPAGKSCTSVCCTVPYNVSLFGEEGYTGLWAYVSLMSTNGSLQAVLRIYAWLYVYDCSWQCSRLMPGAYLCSWITPGAFSGDRLGCQRSNPKSELSTMAVPCPLDHLTGPVLFFKAEFGESVRLFKALSMMQLYMLQTCFQSPKPNQTTSRVTSNF